MAGEVAVAVAVAAAAAAAAGGVTNPSAPSNTQGRACLIARTSSLVILNSISMANGSSAAGSYRALKLLWIVVR